jgi:CRP-like cAMP-binding protein
MSVEKLARLPLFRSVPEDSLEKLLEVCRPTRYRTATRIFEQGSPADQALLLVEGRLEVSVKSGPTHRHVGEIHPGEVVGEQALFVAGGQRNASVFANQPSTALVLSPSLFRSGGDDPAIAALERHLIATLSRRIRKTNLEIQKAWKESRVEEAEAQVAAEAPTLRDRLRSLFGGRF